MESTLRSGGVILVHDPGNAGVPQFLDHGGSANAYDESSYVSEKRLHDGRHAIHHGFGRGVAVWINANDAQPLDRRRVNHLYEFLPQRREKNA